MALLGTLVNVGAIILGALAGVLLTGMRDETSKIVLQAIGLVVVVIGFSMVLQTDDYVTPLLALVFGGILGNWWRLEERMNRFGQWIERKIGGKSPIAVSFVSGTLLFCVGAMAIVGALNSGLQGDHQVLYTKALLDGFMAIIFSATLGIGVLFSAIPVFLYQGGMAILAEWITQFMDESLLESVIMQITSVGGVLIIGLGLNLLSLTTIRVADFLPALPLAVACALFLSFFA